MKADTEEGSTLLSKELIIQVRSGDQDAFERLYRLYADRAIRAAAAITGNRASAADVVQETFIRVYRSIGTYDPDKPFDPWFNRILINECSRYMKKYGKVIPMPIDEQQDLPPAATDGFARDAELYELVQELDEALRVPVILKYVNDLTEKDIAAVLELNVNTVKSRLFKARKKLREWTERGWGGKRNGS